MKKPKKTAQPELEIEIETKWCGDKVSREHFMTSLKKLMEDTSLHCGVNYKRVSGPDVYISNDLGYVARVRVSGDRREITVKARLSESDITKRIEYNIPLDLKAPPQHLMEAFRYLGFSPCLELRKTCDIFNFQQANGVNVQVVFYTVLVKGLATRQFIEIEPEHGTEKQRMKLLTKWSTLIMNQLGLTEADKINLSLYEIYTSDRYHSY